MNRSHRILALLLAVLLLFLLLSACESQPPAEESAAPEQTEPPATTSPSPEPTPEPSPSPSPTPLSETAAGLQITELMPANRSFLPDEQGKLYDWIELCNSSDREISLEGLCLSNSQKDLARYPLPGQSLGPGEYLLVFCGSPDGAPFSLKREGETVYLTGIDGSLLQAITYEETEPDASVCFRDGEAYALPFASPGYPNDEQGYADFLQASDRHGDLVISEIVGYNEDFSSPMNQRGKYYDWVELQNASQLPLDLGEYYLSDDPEDLRLTRLASVTLAPGECVLIYCSGDSSLSTKGYCHADFRIHTGETVYLTHADRGLSDLVCLPSLPGTGSYGRMAGCAGHFYFEKRSPGQDNRDGFRLVSRAPSADLPQGIYNDAEGLQLRLDGPGEIRYTLDGSYPTLKSPLYEEPIPLDKTTVVRAVSFEEDRHPSPCLDLSYIVNESHTLPVVSVLCDQKDFQYLNTFISDVDHEIPGHAVFFEGPCAEPLFDSGCSIKLHGASSRKFPKKSYKLVFQDRYGGDIWADVFQRGEVKRYHALTLRGQTVEHMYVVKDSLISLAALKVTEEPLTLDSRFCIVYINAQYYGIYSLREAYGEQYAMDHTGSTKGNVLVENNRGPHVRPEIYDYLRGRHMERDDEYAAFSETFDVDAFATWLGIEAYFNNEDPDGNIRYIRGDGTDWKWTAALFDLDISIDTMYGDYSYFFSANSEIAMVAARLLPNAQFREALLRNASRLYHNGLGSALTRQLLADCVEQLEPEIPRNCARWSEFYYHWNVGKGALYKRLGDQRTLNWIYSLQRITKASDEEIEYWFGDLSVLESEN